VRLAIVASVTLLLALFGVGANAATFELGTLYQCPNAQSFKVLTCAGPAEGDWCDVQSFLNGQPLMHGRSTRAQILGLLPRCTTQSPVTTGAAAPAAAGPAGVDRPYHVHDKVQVNASGVGWMDGEVVSIADGIETEYKVAVSGNRFLLATYHDLRFVSAAPPPPAFQPGQAPKPGLSSCAGKFEGRYGPAEGPGPTITFHSGKATLREPDMVMTDGKLSGTTSERAAECWMGGGKIYLRWVDGSSYDFPIDINDDGTIDTPEGELKRKGG